MVRNKVVGFVVIPANGLTKDVHRDAKTGRDYIYLAGDTLRRISLDSAIQMGWQVYYGDRE